MFSVLIFLLHLQKSESCSVSLRFYRFPAAFFHKCRDNSNIFTFIIFYKQLLEFRHFFFGNQQETYTMRNKIMVCKNDRSTLVSIREYLSLHAVKAQFDGNVNRFIIFPGNLKYSIFYIPLIRQRWNVRLVTYCNRKTSYTATFGKKAFIYKPCNMTE